ncbi:MAG: hypothetical protein CMJ81_00735 [Planctomycetaceae bacterium]|nr:hypothetical protein [Planctomycetaceae bacterium]MBP60631.1 hypothetical protein [Planctomycetaceae bacterium]
MALSNASEPPAAAIHEYETVNLQPALDFLKRTRSELRTLRKCRVWTDKLQASMSMKNLPKYVVPVILGRTPCGCWYRSTPFSSLNGFIDRFRILTRNSKRADHTPGHQLSPI